MDIVLSTFYTWNVFLKKSFRHEFYFGICMSKNNYHKICLILPSYIMQVMKRQRKAFLGFSTSKQDKIYTFFTLLLLLIFFIKIMNLQCCLYAIFTNYCFHFIKHCNLSIKSVMDYTRKTDIISILILLILIFWCSEVNIH